MTSVDVLVVGAGPAGMAAATAAAQAGRSVLLVDDNPSVGGQIWRAGTMPKKHERDSARQTAVEKLAVSGVALRTGWRIFDAPEPYTLHASSGDHIEQFPYKKLVIATGARERFLPFPGWTMPGVLGAGGLQALVKGGLPVSSKRVVVAGSGPLLLAVATHLQEYGAQIVSVNEQAPLTQMLSFAPSLLSSPAKLLQGLGYRAALARTPYRTACWPVAALGDTHLTAVRLTDGSRIWEEPCNFLACGFHLVPNTELASLLGCDLRGEFVQVNALQETSRHDVYCVGEPAGIAGLDAAVIQGRIAGLACSGKTSAAATLSGRHRESIDRFTVRLEKAFRLRPQLLSLASAETPVCRCEDVTFEQVAPFTCWTEAKLQTRCGMGPCQGRICGPATQAIFGWKTTSVRAPMYPVSIAAFNRLDPQHPTAMKENA